jgi:dolichol-phosphate mannosyltransferase
MEYPKVSGQGNKLDLILIIIFFTSGTILTGIGIIGIYIGKIYDEVRRRPLYVVEE